MNLILTLYLALSLIIPNAFLPMKAQEVSKSIVKPTEVSTKAPVDQAKAMTKVIEQRATIIKPAKLKQTVGAWLPYWDTKNANNSFKRNKKIINELSPYSYFVKENGGLVPSAKMDPAIIKEAREQGVKIIPMVSNDFNGDRINQILNNPTLRKNHINALVQKVVQGKFDGIDLDYEGLKAQDRKMYSYFVKVLADKLHKKGKMLSVTVMPKLKEPGLSSGAKAADWKEIGKHADRVRIMAYDYHWKTSVPGPIAPKFWIDKIAKFAKTTMPSKKVVIGIGTYGYNWKGGRAEAITMAQARQLSKAKKVPIRRDAASHEQFLKLGPGKPKIWLQDAGSLKAKIDIVKKHNLGGIVFWRLGDEDPQTWKIVKEHLRS